MDAMDPQDDGPEAAFEALRQEVAALRRGLELVYRQVQQPSPGAPDPSPQLTQISHDLQTVAGRLSAIEGKPALMGTSKDFQRDIQAAAHELTWGAARPFEVALVQQGVKIETQLTRFAGTLDQLLGRARDQREQRRRMRAAGLLSFGAGVLAVFVAAAVLPAGAEQWMIGSLIGGGDLWHAGEVLLQEANPALWDRMARLYKACPADSQIELCEAILAVGLLKQSQPLPALPKSTHP